MGIIILTNHRFEVFGGVFHCYLAISACKSLCKSSIRLSSSAFYLRNSSFSALSESTSVSEGAPRHFLMNSMALPGFSGSS